jgi:hypothetical protein
MLDHLSWMLDHVSWMFFHSHVFVLISLISLFSLLSSLFSLLTSPSFLMALFNPLTVSADVQLYTLKKIRYDGEDSLWLWS